MESKTRIIFRKKVASGKDVTREGIGTWQLDISVNLHVVSWDLASIPSTCQESKLI